MSKEDIEQFKKEMANLKPGEGVQVGDTKYEYGSDLEATPQQIDDPGTGRTVTIRTFDFAISPKIPLKEFPKNKQKIFSDHAHLIKTMLWADGLIPYEGNIEVAPKVLINLKQRTFKIIVVAQARSSTSFYEKPKSLNKLLASTATPK